MRVLLVNDYEAGGGAEAHVSGLRAVLSGAGHEVRLLHGNKGLASYFGRLGNPLLTSRAKREMANFQPDIVHVHKHNLYWGASPFVAARLLGIPLVCTEHDFSGICPEGWMVDHRGETCTVGFGGACWNHACLRSNSFALGAYRRFNLVRLLAQFRDVRSGTRLFLAPSNFLVHWLRRKYAPIPARTMPSSVAIPTVLRRTPPAEFTIFLASRLEREKGVDILLRAMALAPKTRVVIAGDGSSLPDLKHLASSLDLTDRIEWVGRIGPNDVRENCRKAHLVVQPSLWVEGGGDATLSILEAMAEGCAVASSRFGEEPDVIEDGRNGWLADRGSVAAWSRILTEASASADRCLEMGLAGHRKVAQERSPERLLERITEAYHQAIHGTA